MNSFYWAVVATTLVFSAFFSGMEIAFVSANKLKIELDGKQGDFLSGIISNFLKRPSRFIGAMLVGNNVALVVYGLYMARILEPFIKEYIHAELLVLLIQTIISTVLILITAEFIPKTLFRINPNSILRFFAFPLWLIYWILLIPMLIVIGISEMLIKLFSPQLAADDSLSFDRIDLEHFIREGVDNSDEQVEVEHEVQIFQNALDFSKVKARECMVPRTEVVAMELEDGIEDLGDKFVKTGLSKIIIYKDNIDNIIGYTHSFELFKRPVSIKSILLPIPIIPISMPANEILQILMAEHKSIAVVVDEFGGTAGVLTIEDVIEEIFGEIEDEHDKEELIETRINEHEFLFSARLEVDHLNDEYNLTLPDSDQYETIAGLIINLSERIPKMGDKVELEGFTFTIKKVFDNRIDLVHLQLNETEG